MDEEERGELVAKMFAVMTADLEDAAGLAPDGQGRGSARDQLIATAGRIHGVAHRVAIVADAIVAILDGHVSYEVIE